MSRWILDREVWQEVIDLLNQALIRCDFKVARRVDVYAPGGIRITLLSLTPNYVRIDVIGGKGEDLVDLLFTEVESDGQPDQAEGAVDRRKSQGDAG